MGDLALELVVGLVLAVVGAFVMYLVIGDGMWSVDPYWWYGLGSLVVSVPWIIALERRRRRKF